MLGSFECIPLPGVGQRAAGPAVRITGRSVFSAVTIQFAEPGTSRLRAGHGRRG
jgi:hypothetical protein